MSAPPPSARGRPNGRRRGATRRGGMGLAKASGVQSQGSMSFPVPTSQQTGVGFSHNNGRAGHHARGALSQSGFRGAKSTLDFVSQGQPWRDALSIDVAVHKVKMNELYLKLKEDREMERKEAIRRGFLADPDKPTSLADAITPVGTCQDMCPEYERVERIVQLMVDGSEKELSSGGVKVPFEPLMVKRFRRSAAGYDEQLPSDIRPPMVLKQTLDYLMNVVVDGNEPLQNVHKFVWDRTRGIRNDFSIQQVSKTEDLRIAIHCFERIARFHILSLHQLSRTDLEGNEFDHHQEREQLNNTLLSLMYYYDDSRHKIASPNEPEFRAYSVIFEIQNQRPDLEDRAQNWPPSILRDARIKIALKLYAAAANTYDEQGPLRPRTAFTVTQANFAGFWGLVASKSVPYMMACVTEIYFNHVRSMALETIWKAFKGKRGGSVKIEDWTLDNMANALGFDDEDQTVQFCNDHGLVIAENSQGEEYVDFSPVTGTHLKDENLRRKQVFSYDLVESKRLGRTVPALIDGVTVSEAQAQGLVDESLESEMDAEVDQANDSLFIGEFTETKQQNIPNLSFAQSPFPAPGATAAPVSNSNPFAEKASQQSVVPAANPFTSWNYIGINETADKPTQPAKPAHPAFNVPQANTNPPVSGPFFGSSASPVSATNTSLFNTAEPSGPFHEPPKPFTGTTLPSDQNQKSPFQIPTAQDIQSSTNIFPPALKPAPSPFQTNTSIPPPALRAPSWLQASSSTPPQTHDTGATGSQADNRNIIGPQATFPSLASSQQGTPTFQTFPPVSAQASYSRPDSATTPAAIAKPAAKAFSAPEPIPAQKPSTPQMPAWLTKAGSPAQSSTSSSPFNRPPSNPTPASKPGSPWAGRSSSPSTLPIPPRHPAHDQLSRALDALVDTLMSESGGLLQQYVEFALGPLIKSAWNKFENDRSWEIANDFRRSLLARKYATRWKANAWKQNLRRIGKERRRKLAQSVSEHSQRSPTFSPLTSPRMRRSNLSIANGDIHTDLFTNEHKSLAASSSVQTTHQKRSATIAGLDLTQQALKLSRRGPKASKTLGRAGGSSLHDETLMRQARRMASNARSDTTQTDYFKLKALGIDPDTPMVPETRQKTHRPSQPKPTKTASVPAVSNAGDARKPTSETGKPDDDDEALFASLRAVRERLAESTDWLQSERSSVERHGSPMSVVSANQALSSPACSRLGETSAERRLRELRERGHTPTRTAQRVKAQGSSALFLTRSPLSASTSGARLERENGATSSHTNGHIVETSRIGESPAFEMIEDSHEEVQKKATKLSVPVAQKVKVEGQTSHRGFAALVDDVSVPCLRANADQVIDFVDDQDEEDDQPQALDANSEKTDQTDFNFPYDNNGDEAAEDGGFEQRYASDDEDAEVEDKEEDDDEEEEEEEEEDEEPYDARGQAELASKGASAEDAIEL